MKEYKCGVYLKPNGNLVTVEIGEDKIFWVCTGQVSKSPLIKLLRPDPMDRLLGWAGKCIGWGPTKFLEKCEYLGEL